MCCNAQSNNETISKIIISPEKKEQTTMKWAKTTCCKQNRMVDGLMEKSKVENNLFLLERILFSSLLCLCCYIPSQCILPENEKQNLYFYSLISIWSSMDQQQQNTINKVIRERREDF